jgi:glutamate 5-kinase
MTTETVVVKIGTSSVTGPGGAVDEVVLGAIAADVAAARDAGARVVVVTSGAITAGWAEVGAGHTRPSEALVLQAVSAVGQPLLMDAWRRAFATHNTAVGQVLLAPTDFASRSQYLHARATIDALDDLGVVAIVNENDAVADQEIRYGDNDRLAALVANLVSASTLVLLTDTPGLLTADPRLDTSATLIEEVVAIDRELESLAGASASGVGSGGMASKLAAARLATWSGVETVIAPARATEPLARVLRRDAAAGTWFRARSERLPARKAWIAFAVPASGRLVVNDGAVTAITEDGRSLLRVGVVSHEGSFDVGDGVEIVDGRGELVAKGLATYAADALDDVDGVVVHRDDMVVLRMG